MLSGTWMTRLLATEKSRVQLTPVYLTSSTMAFHIETTGCAELSGNCDPGLLPTLSMKLSAATIDVEPKINKAAAPMRNIPSLRKKANRQGLQKELTIHRPISQNLFKGKIGGRMFLRWWPSMHARSRIMPAPVCGASQTHPSTAAL